MLDDPDATNSKPIEKLFGNLDREIRKTGPQGFMIYLFNMLVMLLLKIMNGEQKQTGKKQKF